jgi:hypothetical protein
MSLQGPVIVVAESPATALVETLSAAGAFPIVEARWTDAPTAFIAVKPAAVVIAEPGRPLSESSARMLSRQIATADGPIVPAIACVEGEQETSIPAALPIDVTLPVERLIARLNSALRVRALHATVLHRIETFTSQGGTLPPLPVHDALQDASVLVVGRGPLFPTLSVTIGERVHMAGALSVETAARHLNARDIDGVVVGDGLSPRMVETFLTVLAQEDRFRDIPVAVIGDAPPDFADTLPNIDHVDGDPVRIVPRMLPLMRMHAFESRMKRILKSLDACGMFDPDTGLLSRDAFWRDLGKAMAQAGERSQALSIARFSFDGPADTRTSIEGARLLARLIRDIDFATREDDGNLLITFTQTDLREAHVVVRRIAGALRNAMFAGQRPQDKIAANVTLATTKAGDTIDTLMLRVMDSRVVAAE